ncbi:ArnT family glycosyltransferase [Sphingorhabdus arenilitoris]|uniref:ArnT family glycosyltransferase n=1 Tax=Sphingorhabdus arenilitoris TaxID=1490041 RepID=A0ABV8RG18_9SPHN
MKLREFTLPNNKLLVFFLLMLAGLLLRLWHVGAGLPGMYDPDEPMFMLRGIELLTGRTLNPGWFGHPGSTTIYCLAIIEAVYAAVGIASGQYAGVDEFILAAYRDPTGLVLSARLFIVACAMICLWLTYDVSETLFSDRIAALALLFLVINPLHIQQSQIIRTDIQATIFMLLAVKFAIAIYRKGTFWSYFWAGISVGFACASKWPAALAGIAPALAIIMLYRDSPRLMLRGMLILAAVSLAGLFIASPYIFIEYQTVLHDVAGEARSNHPGSTGTGFWGNIWWYLTTVLYGCVGIAGLIFASIGIGTAFFRNKLAAATVGAVIAIFLILISLQSLRWERWIVPLLPFISIFMAVGVFQIIKLAKLKLRGLPQRSIGALLVAVIAIPMVFTVYQQAAERGNDTRLLSSAWVIENVPANSSVLIEYFAFDLANEPWELKFPAGDAGCVNAMATLSGGMNIKDTDKWRSGSAIVDIGSVKPTKLDSCVSDYAILTNYARYRDNQALYRSEYRNYRALIEKGEVVKHILPKNGVRGGPEIFIVKTGIRKTEF